MAVLIYFVFNGCILCTAFKIWCCKTSHFRLNYQNAVLECVNCIKFRVVFRDDFTFAYVESETCLCTLLLLLCYYYYECDIGLPGNENEFIGIGFNSRTEPYLFVYHRQQYLVDTVGVCGNSGEK